MKRVLLCLTALLALLALSGCGYVSAQQEPSTSSAPPSGPATPAMQVAGSRGSAPTEVAAPALPTRLRLGAIDAPVVPVKLDGSALTPPDDPQTLGWWGKRAGSRHGTTLLTGHTVHDGGGTFDDLEDTPVGARAQVNGHAYEITSVEVISKGELARRAPALFAQAGRPKLVLVTCEDYDRTTGHYASNVVVTATPMRRPSAVQSS